MFNQIRIALASHGDDNWLTGVNPFQFIWSLFARNVKTNENHWLYYKLWGGPHLCVLWTALFNACALRTLHTTKQHNFFRFLLYMYFVARTGNITTIHGHDRFSCFFHILDCCQLFDPDIIMNSVHMYCKCPVCALCTEKQDKRTANHQFVQPKPPLNSQLGGGG